MEPQRRQHVWFWIAAACLVGSVMSLRTNSYTVIENAVETAPMKLTEPVYRSRSALSVSTNAESLLLTLPPLETTASNALEHNERPPLILPPQSLDDALSRRAVFVETEQVLTTNFQELPAVKATVPESVWLSGGIESND